MPIVGCGWESDESGPMTDAERAQYWKMQFNGLVDIVHKLEPENSTLRTALEASRKREEKLVGVVENLVQRIDRLGLPSRLLKDARAALAEVRDDE